MDYIFEEKYFINPAIDCGIKNYLKYKETGEYNRAHTFEMYIIKALCNIYGEKSIVLPYKIDNEKAFKCNLLMYDLKELEMNMFISLMQEYFDYIKNINKQTKPTSLVAKIEYILIDMINCRGRKREYTEEELRNFEEIFNPSEGNLKQLKNLVSTDQGLISLEWKNKKNELTNTQINLMAINPTLLNPIEYEVFGLDFKEIAKMTPTKIEEINKKILLEKNKIDDSDKIIRQRGFKFALTSGSGFVDKLMLLSIIMTGVMVTLVIATHLGG